LGIVFDIKTRRVIKFKDLYKCRRLRVQQILEWKRGAKGTRQRSENGKAASLHSTRTV